MRLLARIRKFFGRGCKVCGEPHHFHWNEDGDKVFYCIDHWPGYESCAYPGCNHYECEHCFGETWETIYVKPGAPGSVGDQTVMPVGCMNAGCECPGFRSRAEQNAIVDDFGQARREAYWKIGELEGVEDVLSGVETCVTVRTVMNNPTKELREAVFNEQARLMQKYPKVVFDFNIIPVGESINEHEHTD